MEGMDTSDIQKLYYGITDSKMLLTQLEHLCDITYAIDILHILLQLWRDVSIV